MNDPNYTSAAGASTAVEDTIGVAPLPTESTFNPLAWVFVTATVLLLVWFVARPHDGKVMAGVGGLVWFYILFCAGPRDDSSGAIPRFGALGTTELTPFEGTDPSTALLWRDSVTAQDFALPQRPLRTHSMP